MNCQFVLLNPQLMKFAMGDFRAYISADGFGTSVLRHCAGHMVEIFWEMFLHELQDYREVKMGKDCLQFLDVMARKAMLIGRLLAAKVIIFAYGGSLGRVCKDVLQIIDGAWHR